MNTQGLGLLQSSAVKEMANIGLGHAATALAGLTGQTYVMDVPVVERLVLEDVPQFVGGREDVMVAVYMDFEGDVVGQTAYVFPWDSAQVLWATLVGKAPATPDDVDELAASATLEVGNIICSSFLNAISDLTGLRMHATPPMVSIDSVTSILSTVAAEAEIRDLLGLVLETDIRMEGTPRTPGYFLCMPNEAGLSLLLERMGVSEAA